MAFGSLHDVLLMMSRSLRFGLNQKAISPIVFGNGTAFSRTDRMVFGKGAA
jgi:hypothetical protein